MKILFSGGGTLGPVTPLLAIYETILEEHPNVSAVWVGTKHGPEKTFVESKDMLFLSLHTGKFRRYVSFWNIVDIFRTAGSFFVALYILLREKPDVCISAGGYTSVPIHWAAWFLGISTWIHQQDVHVGLSNKLMAPFASAITTALESQVSCFSKKKVSWLGNPVRREIFEGSKDNAYGIFSVDSSFPVVFATGGGTGSLKVNQLIVEAVQQLEGTVEVIHLTGKERPQELAERAENHVDHYQVHQFFLEEMKDAYAIADIVVSRGGFGTITEIAALGKAAILVPKPGQQQQNVQFLADAGAAIILNERTHTGLHLAGSIKELLDDEGKRKEMGKKLQALLPRAKDEDILHILSTLTS